MHLFGEKFWDIMNSQSHREIQSQNTVGNKEGCIDICRCFSWMEYEFTSRIESLSREFFLKDINFYLLAITSDECIVWSGQEYFVTQAELAQNCLVKIRLSDDAVLSLLLNTLGEGEKYKKTDALTIKNISDLEGMIITSYNRFLIKNFQELIQGKKKLEKAAKSDPKNKRILNLTYFIYLGEEFVGKLIVTFPEFAIKYSDSMLIAQEKQEISFFDRSMISTSLVLGSAKVSIEELKNIEEEDIIVLENSNINFAKIKIFKGIRIRVSPDPSLVIYIDRENYGEEDKMSDSSKDMWDNLLVDITAEFDKVKVSLGELRNITEGLIVDIAPVIKNKVYLKVEDKKVAAGEVVIIGDNYGIKITQLIQEDEQESVYLPLNTAANNQTMEQEGQEILVENKEKYEQESSEEDDIEEGEGPEEESDFDLGDFEVDEDEEE